MATQETELSSGDRLVLAQVMAEMERRGISTGGEAANYKGPRTDDELWQAVYELTGYKIPRAAVCEGHSAPFELFADLFFERRTDVLCIGNRGGGKTTLSGFLHGAKAHWHEEYKSAIAGAVEKQSQRAYKEFGRFIRTLGDEIVSSIASKTEWVDGGETEVLGGTVKQLNGPHPYFAQFDEVELTEPGPLGEFENMAQGDQRYQAQTLLTSTRKRPSGLVQALVEEIREALEGDLDPPRDLMIFCVFETMENVPECGTTCGCDKVVKGKWKDGSPRTLMDVCGGKAKKADGFVRLGDVQKRFRKLSRRVWEAQQECKEVGAEGLVHGSWWNPEYTCIKRWYPLPEYGPVYRSWDWGGTDPHSVHFAQVLRVPVTLDGRTFQVGTQITFDEVYYTGGSFKELGLKVFSRTRTWTEDWGYDFEVEQDFADPAGKTPKEDVRDAARDHDYDLPRFKSIPAGIIESLDKHIELGEDGLIIVVAPFCPWLVKEYGLYSWPEKREGQPPPKKPLDVNNHAMDEQRYRIWNLYRMSKRNTGDEAPSSSTQPRTGLDALRAEAKAQKRMDRTGSPVGSSAVAPGYVHQTPEHAGEVPTVRRAGATVRR